MQAKEFQKDAIETVEKYLGVLREELNKWNEAQEDAKKRPGLSIQAKDFTEEAWDRLKKDGTIQGNRSFSARKTGTGEPVPNFTLKVPTGGGKTYLGVQTIGRIVDKFLEPNSEKLILWIVPSEAIYTQTKAALTDREHALRKSLDVASGNRVQILEKDSPLNRNDLQSQWTILLLMLPSANRQDAVSKLKMFQDRGHVNGFLPADDNQQAHAELKRDISNLDTVDFAALYDAEDGEELQVGMIRASLGNALRIVRPVIILDEGHKGFSDLAHKTLYGFNPRIVVELTATPKDQRQADANGYRRMANILVEITGKQLHDEEMIKQPLMGYISADHNPYAALYDAWNKLEDLQQEADNLYTNGGGYIRPILLVQVERTGEDHADGDNIHANHVRTWFVDRGVPAEAIAIKTSEQNDLAEFPPGDLIKPANPIRVIITKAALQEGWDCPFAYVLCALAANRSPAAMTQLIGRILRQPYVRRSGVDALDQCYVYTNRVETNLVTESVRKGLEEAGMGDLVANISEGNKVVTKLESQIRRGGFTGREYYLPQVMIHEGEDNFRPLDWENDILGYIDWESLNVQLEKGEISSASAEKGGVIFRQTVEDLPWDKVDTIDEGTSRREFDFNFAIRGLLDDIPNAWVAYSILTDYLEFLRKDDWTEEKISAQQGYLMNELRKKIRAAVDVEAQLVYEKGLADNRIIFRLTPTSGWPLPKSATIEISEGGRRLRREDDSELMKSLLVPIFDKEFNELEKPVAVFLDQHEAVLWWYRNAVRGQAYGLQGWRRQKIYPDFVIALEQEGEVGRWLVIETKGDQLIGNNDSLYKERLLDTLTDSNATQAALVSSQPSLFSESQPYVASFVKESYWKRDISKKINAVPRKS